MASVGHWVLRRACLDLVTLQAAAPRPLRLVINVSHVELARAEFATDMLELLATTGFYDKTIFNFYDRYFVSSKELNILSISFS